MEMMLLCGTEEWWMLGLCFLELPVGLVPLLLL